MTEFLTIPEYMQKFRYKTRLAVIHRIERKQIPAVRVGRRWLIPMSYVEKLAKVGEE